MKKKYKKREKRIDLDDLSLLKIQLSSFKRMFSFGNDSEEKERIQFIINKLEQQLKEYEGVG